MIRNFCGKVLSEGGELLPLIIPFQDSEGTGLMNPSILIDDGIYVNIRQTNYILYHNEGQQHFYSVYGPLVYMNPENDQHLKTNNFFCHMNEDLTIRTHSKIDTKKFDDKLVYAAEFHGLEDGRLVKWDDKLFICGVRRDTEPTGIGRIELSEIVINDENSIEEINRYRIEPPKKGSHCEKNWMPIADMPFHFVKWTNPLEVIKVIPYEGDSETVVLHHDIYPGVGDIRGGSQVISIGEYRVCVIHEVNLKSTPTGRKDAKYVHRFVIWDKEWNLVKMTEPFSFLNGEIEFCCGLAVYGSDVLITFGFQDNAAYLLKMTKKSFNDYTGIDFKIEERINVFSPVYYVSGEKYADRQREIEKQARKLNIELFPVIITEEMDKSVIAEGKYVSTLDEPTLYAVTSHLRAIKQWVNESKSAYAIFVEDDVDLRPKKYWAFSWNEFMNELPVDYDCLQLCCVRQDLSEIKLRKRQWDDWSATAYLLKRGYAIKLINKYYQNDIFTLDVPNDVQPLLENIVFSGTTYMIPLFTENMSFKSTSHNVVLKEEYKPNHYESAVFIAKWWKDNGLTTTIKTLLS